MKSMLTTTIIAIIAAFGTVHFIGDTNGASSTKTETAYERVMRTGVLRCGYGMWEPLFGVSPETGKRHGIFYELTEQIGKLMNLEIEWVEEVPWEGMVAGLNAGRYDAVCSGKWVYGAQGAQAAYAMPVMFNIVHAYARVDDNRFEETLSNLNSPEFTIAVQDGDVSLEIAESLFPEAKRVAVVRNSATTLLMTNVANLKSDITFMDAATARGFSSKNPNKLKIITKTSPIRSYQTTYMYQMHDYALGNLLNASLRQLQDSGVTENIINKYIKNKGDVYIPQKNNRPL